MKIRMPRKKAIFYKFLNSKIWRKKVVKWKTQTFFRASSRILLWTNINICNQGYLNIIHSYQILEKNDFFTIFIILPSIVVFWGKSLIILAKAYNLNSYFLVFSLKYMGKLNIIYPESIFEIQVKVKSDIKSY